MISRHSSFGHVVTGTGPEIHALLFGLGPTDAERRLRTLQQALTRLGYYRAMIAAFPLTSASTRLRANEERGRVRRAIRDIREARI